MKHAVLLYGPPAAGKDTITAEICRQQPQRFALYKKLKAGSGRIEGYRPAALEDLADSRRRGEILHETCRYGSVYAVDHAGFDAFTRSEMTPVVHMGQLAGVRRLRAHPPFVWVCVLVWCDRAVPFVSTSGETGDR
jgi:guanylate kinase